MNEATPTLTAASQMQSLVLASFQKLEGDGTLAKLVEDQVRETMKGLVKDTLREYSTFGKALRERIEAQAQVNFHELNLPCYNHVLIQAIEREYMEAMQGVGMERVLEHVREIFGTENPKSFKLSQIIETMRDDYYDDGEYHKMTLDIDDAGHGLVFIAMDPESDTAKYKCRYRLTVSDGKVTSVDVREEGGGKLTGIHLGRYGAGVASMMVSAHMRGAAFEVDCDEECEHLYFGSND